MSTLTWAQEQRIQRNRRHKARRFLSHFFHQMRAAGVAAPETNKAALEETIAIVRAATAEQWAQLAKTMGEKKEPSGATVTLIVEELQTTIANLDHKARQADEDLKLFQEALNQRGTGSVGAQVLVEEGSR